MVAAARGYRVLFMTFAREGLGFWLRYTILLREGGYSAVWLTVFEGGRPPRGVAIKHGLGDAVISQGYARVGPSVFSFSQLEAGAETGRFRWHLKLRPLQGAVNPVPPLLRLVRRSSKYIIVSPNTIFDGSITFDGRGYEVEGCQGTVGYITAPRYLHHWVWAHCSGFDEDRDAWLDLLIASPEGAREVMMGAARLDGEAYRIGGLLGASFKGSYDRTSLKAPVGLARGVSADVEVRAARDSMVVARYEDPVEGHRYCHNTEVADMSVTIRRGGEARRLTCTGRAFYEYVLPRPPEEGLTVLEPL